MPPWNKISTWRTLPAVVSLCFKPLRETWRFGGRGVLKSKQRRKAYRIKQSSPSTSNQAYCVYQSPICTEIHVMLRHKLNLHFWIRQSRKHLFLFFSFCTAYFSPFRVFSEDVTWYKTVLPLRINVTSGSSEPRALCQHRLKEQPKSENPCLKKHVLLASNANRPSHDVQYYH